MEYEKLCKIRINSDSSLDEDSRLFLSKLCGNREVDELFWIPQGGAMKAAEDGVSDLALEIFQFAKSFDRNVKWKVISLE